MHQLGPTDSHHGHVTAQTHHIRAHLRPRPEYQFTLFIDVVYLSGQLLRESVGPRNGLVEQALAVPCAIKK